MKSPKVKPREHQRECLAAIDDAIARGEKRALVVMASSLGKTYTSAFAVEKFFAERPFSRVLILCHSESILRQSKDKFKAYFGEEFSYGMYVDCDKTTRPTNFLFATFQTMKENRKDFSKDAFAYIVVDEAHHSKARTYFPTIRYFCPEFLLGLTATPDRLDGQKIEEIYGEPVYELGFVEATKRGLIAECDYRLVLDDLSQERLDEYLASDKKLSVNQLNRTLFIEKRDEEIVRLIREYSAEVKNPKTMIFCRTITHARIIARLMGDDAILVHKKNSDSANDHALRAFKNGEINTIISVDMLNEGVDIPDANIIVFLRNTVSPAVFYQQLGRGTRLSEGKEKALILDFVNNCERIKMILELKQEIDDFEIYPPHGDDGAHGDGDADSKEKFTLNIATQFNVRMMDIIEILDRTQDYWSETKLIECLQQKAKQLGRTPSGREMDADPKMPYVSYFRAKFGSYNNAIERAGLKCNQANSGTQLDDEAMLSKLRSLAKKNGYCPTCSDIDEAEDMPEARTYKRRFNSLERAIQLAGIDEPSYQDFLLSWLIRKYQELKRIPLPADLDLDPEAPNTMTYVRKLNGVSNALVLAGLKTELEEQMLLDLARIYKKINKRPTSRDLGPSSQSFSAAAYNQVFGSLKNALDMVEIKHTIPRYTKEEILELLKQKEEELGRWPQNRELDADPRMPASSTVRVYFGGVENAKKIAHHTTD